MADLKLIKDENDLIERCELHLSVMEVLTIKQALRIASEDRLLSDIDREAVKRLYTEI